MNSFYKGGSELPTVKVSSCSNRIKSKKLGLLALKLVAHFRLYFTSIDKALVKHSLSTDIVLFTQTLRKRLEKGKTCYQRACQLLYTYLINGSSITVEKLVQKPAKSKTFSSAFFLTNFAPTSAFHAFGSQPSVAVTLVFPEGDPKPARRNTEQRWEKGRSWLGNDQVLKINRSGIIKFFLCCTVFVPMFSLSAQTPRKDSGADGLSQIQALRIGDTIPDHIWNLKMPVYNDSKGRSSISLNDYKDNKLIILDFWATWCSNCLEGFPKLDVLKDTFKEDFGVLLINCKKTGDNKEKIDRVFKKYNDNYQFNVQFPYLIADTIFDVLFPHRGVPHVVWIGNDRVVKAITYTAELQADNVRQILAGQKANFYRKEDDKYKVEDSISTDTLRLFSSYLSKRREGIREMGVEIKEKGNEKELTFLNSSVAMRIYEYLRDSGHPIERNLWVFDNNVSKELRRKFKTPQRYVDEYCYFLRYPKDRNDFDPYRKMIHDIQDGFGIKWEVRKGILKVWKIESSPEAIRYRTKGKIPLVAIGINDNKKFIQNIPLRNSFNALSWFLNKPVVLGDIADINIDFELPTDLLDYTDEQLRKLLERLGAKITVEQQEVAYVYFSKERGR